MKKTIQLTLLLITLLSFSSNKALAYDIAVENEGVTIYYNYTSDGKELSVTDLNYGSGCYYGNVVIPKEVTYMNRTRKVTSIGDYAFLVCSGLTSVTIPNSVTSIGAQAFSGCTGLTSVTIPNSVTSIGYFAFSGCTGLTSFNIPNSVTIIEDGAFSECGSLITVNIPNSVTSLGNAVFSYCNNLTSITIPNSVTTIGEWSFVYCSSLTEITIPNSVTFIGDQAFVKCSSLTSFTIPNSVTSIGEWAFSDCTSLTSVTIPNSVTYIGQGAFQNCGSLTSVSIPNSVTTIAEWTFSGCNSLTEITIPNSATIIGEWAFWDCSSLVSVVSEIEEPFEIHSNTFEQTTYNNATLYVPKGSKYKYKTTDNWNKFNIIISEGSYKLSYVVDGEEYQTKNVEEAEAITPIDEPTKEGYTFSGWNGVPEIMPANDVIVTGTFTINKYKVTYIVDGAEYKTTEVEYGSTLTAEAEPTKEGYSFSGWSDIPSTMPAHDVTVTGNFSCNSYILTYMVDGEEYKSSEVDYGTAITAEAVPTKEGYTFSGWSDIPKTMPASDVTVTGTFTVNKYTITYVVDGVTLTTEDVEYGTTITPPTSQKDGYEISWNAHPTTMPAYGITIYGSYISTGIKNINRETITDNRYFNLNGQRIEGQPSQKGVYIKNGKKVLMK